MGKYALLFLCMLAVCGCDKHDPILPGVRSDIFQSNTARNVLNDNVPDLPDAVSERNYSECKYFIDASNTIRDEQNRKIFVGFASPNSVDIKTSPVCVNGYIYAGLNTGNVVKISAKNHNVIWMADVYSESNMMGGATTVDIVAPLVIDGTYIYVGGMGDAFCKININNGYKKWCTSVGTRYPFVVLKNVAYVMGLDDVLYAIRLSDGAIYWHKNVTKANAPEYRNMVIHIGDEHFDAKTGDIIKG